MSITWNTGLAAERARHNLKLKNKRRPAAKAPSSKLQAPSSKLQAPSSKLQAPSIKLQAKKDLDSHKIPDIK